MIVVKILYSILLISAGYSLIRYRRVVKSWTGSFVWAEQYLGNGGTYTALLLLGIFLMFLGVIWPFGGLDLLIGQKTSGNTFISR